ncbi:GAF domain-containing protein [Halomicroarcula sp. GCM10025710]
MPVAWSETAEAVVGVPPTFSKGEGLVWETFEAGEPRVFDDLQAVDGVYNPETEIRSEIQLPLGSHGIFVVGAREPGAFDETDVSLAKLFATNIETALDRAADERALKQRERAPAAQRPAQPVRERAVTRPQKPAERGQWPGRTA